MNLKDRIISKLVDVGRKHRILVYPTLALIAVVTAVSHAVCWGKGNGKRMVASIMVVALLFTQSLFLTSSADYTTGDVNSPTDALVQDADTINLSDDSLVTPPQELSDETQVQDETLESLDTMSPDAQPQQAPEGDVQQPQQLPESDADAQQNSPLEEIVVEEQEQQEVSVTEELLAAPGEVNVTYEPKVNDATLSSIYITGTENGTSDVTIETTPATVLTAFGLDSNYFNAELFTDEDMSNPIVGTTIPYDASHNYKIYVRITRTKYTLSFVDADGAEWDASVAANMTEDLPTGETNSGNVKQVVSFVVPAADSVHYRFYKWGYTYKSLDGKTPDGVNALELSSDSVTSNTIEVSVGWSAMENIPVTCQMFETPTIAAQVGAKVPAQIEYQNVNYGSSLTTLAITESQYVNSDAYYFEGWKVDGVVDGEGNAVMLAPGASVTASLANTEVAILNKKADITEAVNVTACRLIGQWKYREVTVEASNQGDASVQVNGTNVSITGTYGDVIDCTLTAKYTKDGKESASFTFVPAATILSDLGPYGLGVIASGNSLKISGTLSNITTATVSTGFSVEDKIDESNKVINPFTIGLDASKRKVVVQKVYDANSKPLKKAYDGNATIVINPVLEVADADGQVVACIADDNVTVSADALATLVDADGTESPNVGTKNVRINNVSLQTTPAGKEGFYDLQNVTGGSLTISDAAEVEKQKIYVSMALANGQSDSILYGATSPSYDLVITNTEDIASGEYSADDPQAFLTNYLGFSGWDTNRKLFSAPATNIYYMEPLFEGAGSGNYDVKVDNKPTFDVGIDVPGSDYYTVEETPVGGYYGSYTIKPTGKNGYDKVRIVKQAIAEDSTRAQVSALFRDKEVLADNGTYTGVQIQFMKSSDPYAVSDIYTISETIQIDNLPSEYRRHTVNSGGYINQLKFGTYYREQSAGKVMTITVVYASNYSPCEYLYYCFVPSDKNPTVDDLPDTSFKTKMTPIGNQEYQATVTVSADYSGQLVVWAVDSKEKSSDVTKLVCYTNNTNAALDADSYEWVVENDGPSASIRVEGNGNTAVGDVWYSNLEAFVDAEDTVSGLDKIAWSIETPSTTVANTQDVADGATKEAKQTAFTFHQVVAGDEVADYTPGEYYFSAIVTDNAGNETLTDRIGPFLFDGRKPEITLKDEGGSDQQYQSNVELMIEVLEGELESGVDHVSIYKGSTDTDPLQSWTDLKGETSFATSYAITQSGTYIVVAVDCAGNQASKEVTYSHVSSQKPDKPEIEVSEGDGALGNEGWYIKGAPSVTIKSSNKTVDGVPVKTYYKISYTDATGKHEYSDNFTEDSHTLPLMNQGNVKIEAWAVTDAGVGSDIPNNEKTISVDLDGPKIEILDIDSKEDGTVTINYRITDFISGVDESKVFINDKKVSVSAVDGVVNSSFVADGSSRYDIVAYDIAGNEADAVSYIPLGLEVSPILNITSTTASIEAQVQQGSHKISPSLCKIEYKKATEALYDEVLADKETTDYGLNMTYDFSKLSPNTSYDYRVTAVTVNGDEERVVEGSFRTLSGESVATVYGNAYYGGTVTSPMSDKPIYVNLYKGDAAIAGVKVIPATDTAFEFDGIDDGSYRLAAGNGWLRAETYIRLEGGKVVYPTDYSVNGGVNLILNPKSTSVVIDDNEIEVAASGMESIFDYSGTYTKQDKDVVASGGRVEIELHASYLPVDNISEANKAIFLAELGKYVELVRYLNLDIVKKVYNPDGSLKYSQNITMLKEPITVSVPLGDLAGQDIRIASIHGANNKVYKWSEDGEATCTNDSVIVTTDRFSLYALYRPTTPPSYTVEWYNKDNTLISSQTVVEGQAATPPQDPTMPDDANYSYQFAGWSVDAATYSNVKAPLKIYATYTATPIVQPEDPEEPEYYTVTWKDTDGKVIRVDTVPAGESVIPPDYVPKKDADSKYEYIFKGWDHDLDNITGDVVMKPQFRKVALDDGDEPGDDDGDKPGDDDGDKPGDDDGDKPGDDDGDKPGDDDGDEPQIKPPTKHPTYTYMGGNSPQTGDETPIVLAIGLLILSGTGVIFLKKKKED